MYKKNDFTAIFSMVLVLWFANPAMSQLSEDPNDSTGEPVRKVHHLKGTISEVQPMTGIVFWDDSSENVTDSISLEYSYCPYNKIVNTKKGVYDWTYLDRKLEAIASRKHQAIFRFYISYPAKKTTVPQYIIDLADYEETVGKSEGKTTHFPDWRHAELERFILEFYTKLAERYDDDPRFAFLQVGFGLWGEYHIYDGPFVLGRTFPSKSFQKQFFEHLNANFKKIPWSISVDAADETYSPFSKQPDLLKLSFGLFDDSFMHKKHGEYNTSCWNFFDRDRYQHSPAGGEFSYYTRYDQQHVLDAAGPHGKPYEAFAADFHITYMIGNDQPKYQSMARIKEASMASGYKFRILSLTTLGQSTVVEVENAGVAPIYYDAYITINGTRSGESLKNLQPGCKQTYTVNAGGGNPILTIECDRLVSGQKIQYEANF